MRLVARKTQDRLLGVARRIVDPHVEQEPVELRFGKGIGAFLLDRILGRHDQEQGRELVRGASHRDLALPHRLEQRGLHLRGRPVHFIGEQHVVEQRAALKHEARVLGPVDLGAGQIGGEQVGSELHPMEVALDTGSKLLDRGGLGKPRRTLHEPMAIGQQRDEKPIDERLLSDDPRAQGIAKLRERALCRRRFLLRECCVVHVRDRG